ncbi:MAG: AraC family transcriptional regulator, partial [Bacteroidota bacterium]
FQQLIQREFEGAYENLNALDVEAVFQTQKIIQESFDNPPTIQNLAREIGMSESKLKKIFKQVFGHSIYQYILHNRMNKARHLLDTRRYNVSEVGSLLGYSNLAHFAKAFKKQFNVSPSTYLASLR